MKTHPEQRALELYLGNTRTEDVWKSSWKTSRLGSYPYCTDAKPYTGGGVLPWFIERSEVELAIQTELFADKPWSPERIKFYQSMLYETKKAWRKERRQRRKLAHKLP